MREKKKKEQMKGWIIRKFGDSTNQRADHH